MLSKIPTRHPDTPGAVPVGVRLIAGALGIDRPSPQRWHQIGVDLTVGDEPMRGHGEGAPRTAGTGLDRAALRGRREQETFMRTMMGADDTAIGGVKVRHADTPRV